MRAALTCLAGLALAGCTAEPAACPGDSQGAFDFSGTVTAAAQGEVACALVKPGSTTGFRATVSFTGGATAAVCLDRLLTEPKLCQRAGDAVAGCASEVQVVTLTGCPCDIRLLETLSGTLERTGSRATGFTGTLLVALSRSATDAAAACYAAQDALGSTASCPPAGGCTARYDLTGAP